MHHSDAAEVAEAPPADGRLDNGAVLLKVSGLTKRYGEITAVDNLSFEINQGDVFGLLGPNGAGKSTTIGAILGLIIADAGKIEAFGLDFASNRWAVLKRIGAIIETPAFYGHLSGRDNLRTLAMSVGGVKDGRIDSLLELVGLGDRARHRFKTYSLGMKQRLGIASTLLTEPDLVILDEPTNGLDPAGQREMRELIPRLATEGHTVLLSSHLLHEVEQICNKVAIMHRGRVLTAGPVKMLLQREQRLRLDLLPEDLEPARGVLSHIPEVESVHQDGAYLIVQTSRGGLGREINRSLAQEGIFTSELRFVDASLEEYFLHLTAEESDA